MWRKRGEADGSWIGPLRVVIQDSHNVVWVTMGSKLFRVAPEHLRPLSAVEEWKQNTGTNGQSEEKPVTAPLIKLDYIIPPHGGVQFHNLAGGGQHVGQSSSIPHDTVEDNTTSNLNIPNPSHPPPSQHDISEQPDIEPVPESHTP